LKFNALTPPAFQIFMHSFDMAEPDYGRAAQQASENKLRLANLNFDIGSMTHAGQYDPQDDAYEFWVDELARLHYATVTTAMRNNILEFYENLKAPIAEDENSKVRERIVRELKALQAAR